MRSRADMETLRSKDATGRLVPVQLDVTVPEQIEAAAALIEAGAAPRRRDQ